MNEGSFKIEVRWKKYTQKWTMLVFFSYFYPSEGFANNLCTVQYSGKFLMKTTLKCEELIEFSLSSLSSASLGAVL